jgi:hypothetical protein
MHRSKLYFLLLSSPLLACADDIPEVLTDGSTGGHDSTTGVTVNPTTVTASDTDTTTDSPTTGLDSTGSSSSGEPGSSSSGEPGSSSSGEPGSSSSGESSSSSSSGGPACGDGMQDAGEECDGADLAGYNCVTLGPDFTGGTLACADDCTFDVSGCLACGNGAIDGAEECDGVDLGGNSCATVGFVDGPLACAVDCSFDTSACTTCGNGVVDAGEACDGADLGGSGCTDLGLGFTGGTLGCDAACGYDSAACTSVPWPVAGEVIITEIMQNPFILMDTDGEFFEVYNPVMGASFQLGGCTVEGATDLGFTIDTDMVIGPLEYRIFATSSMLDQGFVADYQWADTDYNLTNTADTVRIVCNGVMVDEVSYDDGLTFPDPNGQSMSLGFPFYDAVANDSGANWCPASTPFGAADFGTPGTDNPVCMGAVTYPIDFCRLQFPTLIDEIQGTDVTAYGRLYSGGLTDISGVNDPAPEVIGYVGYGPDGTDPTVDATWVWTAGTPNAGYGPASPLYEANNDEYQAVLSVPVPGTYDFAFRFSGDDGATFTYCDGQDPGSSNGYSPVDAGQMTSSPAGPPPSLYFSEYVEGTSNNKAVEIYNPGVAAADLTACEVRIYFNGAVAPTNTIALAGNVAPDDVFVVCDDSIDPLIFPLAGCDLLAPGTFYNGDDVLELACSGIVLDIIGQIGLDPGAEWLVGGVGTQDETIRRSCAVTAGDTNGADVFDPSLEWASFPQNTVDDLGQYVCP